MYAEQQLTYQALTVLQIGKEGFWHLTGLLEDQVIAKCKRAPAKPLAEACFRERPYCAPLRLQSPSASLMPFRCN
jgi:hypothetical protein